MTNPGDHVIGSDTGPDRRDRHRASCTPRAAVTAPRPVGQRRGRTPRAEHRAHHRRPPGFGSRASAPTYGTRGFPREHTAADTHRHRGGSPRPPAADHDLGWFDDQAARQLLTPAERPHRLHCLEPGGEPQRTRAARHPIPTTKRGPHRASATAGSSTRGLSSAAPSACCREHAGIGLLSAASGWRLPGRGSPCRRAHEGRSNRQVRALRARAPCGRSP
jgi:hypothetical protein